MKKVNLLFKSVIPLFLLFIFLGLTLAPIIFSGEGDDGGGGFVAKSGGSPPVIPPMRPSPLLGWPVQIGSFPTSAAIADVDGDGDLEVLVASSEKVQAWHYNDRDGDGSADLVAEWRAAGIIHGSPAIGDLDGDGTLEVVVGTRYGDVYAWHSYDGDGDGEPDPVAGWPRQTNGIVYCSPALGDLDGDGTLEVVVISEYGNGTVYAWHSYDRDGVPGADPVAGWPQATEEPPILGITVTRTPALGDLDGDGTLEVVVGASDGYVHAWHSYDRDGIPGADPVAGWPQRGVDPEVGSFWNYSTPVLADLDRDGTLEIVVASSVEDSGGERGTVYAWHSYDRDGVPGADPVAGWPSQYLDSYIFRSPAVGDLDGDGTLEVVVVSNLGTVYAWHYNAVSVAGWPQPTPVSSRTSPVLADLDGDGTLEVVVGASASDGYVDAWHSYDRDGVPGADPVAGWPIYLSDTSVGSSTIADLDGDGTLEVVTVTGQGSGSSGKLHAWTLPWLSSRHRMPWPMFQKNRHRTGSNVAPVLKSIGTQFVQLGRTLTLQISGSDVDGDRLSYAVGNVRGATLDPVTGSFVWRPTRSGLYGVNFQVSDPDGASDSERVWILVYRFSADEDPMPKVE